MLDFRDRVPVDFRERCLQRLRNASTLQHHEDPSVVYAGMITQTHTHGDYGDLNLKDVVCHGPLSDAALRRVDTFNRIQGVALFRTFSNA